MTTLAAGDTRPTASPAVGRANGVHPDWMRYATPLITEPADKHLSIRVAPIDTPTPVAPDTSDTDRRADSRAAVVRAVAPLVLINALAVYGQLAYAYAHIAPGGWPTPARLVLSVGVAAAAECVALYVGWQAHDALLNKSTGAARRLRGWSYLIASVVACVNYSHFAAAGMRPTAAAVVFGLMSLVSPWLWGLHTRRQQHMQLIRERKVDNVGVEFSTDRRRHFPVRCLMAKRWAIDNNVTDPVDAWEGYKAERLSIRARRQVDTDRPAASDPTPVAGGASTPRQARTDTPTGRKPASRQRRSKKVSTPSRSTPRQATPAPVPVAAAPTALIDTYSPAAVANAADLRQRYGDTLPTADNPIRQATGWSLDRVKKARDAYTAGADRQTPTGDVQ